MEFTSMTFDQKKEAIVALSKQGLSAIEIAKILKTTNTRISNFSCKNSLGIDFRNKSKLCEFSDKELIELYKSTGSFVFMAHVLDVDMSTLNYQLRKRKLKDSLLSLKLPKVALGSLINKKRVSKIKSLLRNGVSTSEVARILELRRDYVQKISYRMKNQN